MPILNLPRTSHGRGVAPVPSALACSVGAAAAAGLAAAIVATTSIACTVAASSAAGMTASIATTWQPGYSLPASGAASLIGTNNADAVKQSGVSSFNFAYATFNAYGGGVIAPDYSQGGVWAIAGSGGHNAPGQNDLVLFDFTDATWKLSATSSVGTIDPSHFNVSDFTNGGAAQTSDGYSEIVAAQPDNVPLPSHLYMSLIALTGAQAGNTKGKIIRYGQSAVTSLPTRIGAVHALNLDTVRWARVASGSRQFSSGDFSFERNTVYDPTRQRVYIFGEALHAYSNAEYLRLSDMTLQISAGYGNPSDWTAGGNYHVMWYDAGFDAILDYSPGNGLRYLQAGNFGAGWTVLSTSGTAVGESSRPAFWPAHNCYYFRKSSGAGQTLTRLTRPSTVGGTWAWSTVTLTGATIPEYTNAAGNGARHYGNLVYVPAIDRLAWVSGADRQVALLYPPNPNPVATFTLTASSTGTQPFALGHVFAKGDMPAGQVPVMDTATSQASIISTWDDGSAKHALLAGTVALTSGVAKTVTITRGTASGTALAESDLIAAAPTASISFGTYGTVSLASMLGTAALVLTEQAGPAYAAFQYIAAFPNDSAVRAVFYVQLWASGRYRVRVAVECATSPTTAAAKSGTAVVTIAGVERFNAAVSMPWATRWDVVAMDGTDPAIVPAHNVAYLRASKLVPNYGWTANSSAISGLSTSYTPLARMGWTQDMGDVGFQPAIGLLPNWDAVYCSSADASAYASVIAHGRAYGCYSIFYRNATTRRVPKITDHPNQFQTWDGGNTERFSGNGTNANTWEMAHCPNAGYLPWLLTGERFFLEVLQANAWAHWLTGSTGEAAGTARQWSGQIRAKAWRYRAIACAASACPDSEPHKADLRANVQAMIDDPYSGAVASNVPATGFLGMGSNTDPDTGNTGFQHSVFESLFLSASLSWSVDLEMGLNSTYKARLAAVEGQIMKVVLGLTGRGPAFSEFSWRRAPGPYRLQIGTTDQVSSSIYSTWDAIYQATYGPSDTLDSSAGLALLESYADDPSNTAFPEGNWGHVMAALSLGVDHGVSGAATAWSRISGASNWAANTAKFAYRPQYGVVPR